MKGWLAQEKTESRLRDQGGLGTGRTAPSSLRRVGTEASERKITQIKAQISRTIDTVCRPDALAKKRLAIWATLIKTRAARRNAALELAKTRFATAAN